MSPAAGHLILLAPIPYGFLPQRPQRLAAEFARAGWRVTYVEPAGIREYLNGSRKGLLQALQRGFMHHMLQILPQRPAGSRSRGHRAVPPGGSIAVFTLPLVVPHNRLAFALLERINARIHRRSLGSVPCPEGERTVVLANNPFWGLVLEGTVFGEVYYDAIDEIALYAGNAPLPRFRKYEELLAARARAVFVTSLTLEEEIRSSHPGVRVVRVPNGVDAAWWSDRIARAPANAEAAALGKPLVGYVGALYQWIDFRFLAEVARLMPETMFLLVGPADSPGRTEPVRNLPNVTVWDRKPYEEVPAIVASCDACIIPMTGVGRSANPVKVYEYFAAGKPVVTTPMRELQEYESRGLAASGGTPEEFASALRGMLASDTDARRGERLRIAEECSWESRARAMLEAMGPGPEVG